MAIMAEMHFEEYKRQAGKGIYNLLLSPWRLTMEGEKFLAGYTGYGFIFLAFFPLLLMKLVKTILANGFLVVLPNRSTWNFFSWFIILFWVLWFVFAFHRGRHLMPVFSLLSIMTATSIMATFKSLKSDWIDKLVKINLGVVLVFGISFQILIALYFSSNFLGVAVGYENNVDFIKRVRPTWEDYKEVDEILPKDALVLHLFGHRQYYLKRKQFYPSPYFQGWIDWASIEDVEDYRKKIKEAGFTHVIASDFEDIDLKSMSNPENWNVYRFHKFNRELVQNYSTKIYSSIRLVPRSRTLRYPREKKVFVLYELH